MAVPWVRIFNAVVGISDLARVVRRPPPAADPGTLAIPNAGALEKTLTGVVVAALKEAFDRDHQRLELERQRLEEERQRAERALRMERLRQDADREIGRLRLLAGVAVASWLGTLYFSTRLAESGIAARASLSAGWVLLIGAVAAAFVGQSQVARSLGSLDDRDHVPRAIVAPASAAAAPWLTVAGLAVIAFGVLWT